MSRVSGGDKFNKALQDLSKRLSGPGPVVRVGFLSGARYPDGTSVAMVAAIQNFGAPSRNIPPRPFFSNMIRDKSRGWAAGILKQLKATNYDADLTLQRVGEGIAGQLRQSIRDFDGVPLKPRTIARKGFDKQLVDTGHMLNSISYEVDK